MRSIHLSASVKPLDHHAVYIGNVIGNWLILTRVEEQTTTSIIIIIISLFLRRMLSKITNSIKIYVLHCLNISSSGNHTLHLSIHQWEKSLFWQSHSTSIGLTSRLAFGQTNWRGAFDVLFFQRKFKLCCHVLYEATIACELNSLANCKMLCYIMTQYVYCLHMAHQQDIK